MLTVTKLAKKFDISRTTVLYYEREGLLVPAFRSDNGYRWYGEIQIKRLESIVAYCSYGLPISTIAELLEQKADASQTELLREHFSKLEDEINQLRSQQTAIVTLLQDTSLIKQDNVTKERWVEIMKMSGFDEDDMRNWHRRFEAMEPEKHHKFLLSLGISDKEIKIIRAY